MRVLVLLATLLLAGCCSEQTRVVEIEYEPFGPGTEDFDIVLLDSYRDTGWDCFTDGSLRDGSGAVIGERWVCTKCE